MCLLLFTGCATPANRIELQHDIDSSGVITCEIDYAMYPHAASLLSGFDSIEIAYPKNSKDTYRTGDSILIGVQIERPSKSPQTWYIRCTVTADDLKDNIYRVARLRMQNEHTLRFDSYLVPILIEIFDTDANLLTSSTQLFPESFVSYGVISACENELRGSLDSHDQRDDEESTQEDNASETTKGVIELDSIAYFLADGATIQNSIYWESPSTDRLPLDPEQNERLFNTFGSFVSLLSMSNLIGDEKGLDGLRDAAWHSVFRMPSLLSIMFGGISVGVDARFDEAINVQSYHNWLQNNEVHKGYQSTVPHIYRVPVDMKVNDQVSTVVQIVVTGPVHPIRLTGGMLAFDATHPSRDKGKITARLLAARRGTQGL